MIYLANFNINIKDISNRFVIVCNIGIYKLNDLKFEMLPEDFARKLEEPRLIPVARSRVNYVFRHTKY